MSLGHKERKSIKKIVKSSKLSFFAQSKSVDSNQQLGFIECSFFLDRDADAAVENWICSDKYLWHALALMQRAIRLEHRFLDSYCLICSR